MLSANKEKLQSFFQGSNQFIIPFFQRSYVWRTDNWLELWENITEVINDLEIGENSEHFIGTIIVQQAQTEKLGSLVYNLIDGQQRLTTLCLLLRALHDSSDDVALREWIINLLIFKDSYGVKNIRIKHSKIDKEHFQNILLSEDNNDSLYTSFEEKYEPLNIKEQENYFDIINRVDGAYLFFRTRIKEQLLQDKIRTFVTILLEKLPVIHMALTKEDDVQQIFDTINSLGVKLTTAELLKNHLYATQEVASKYNEYWYDIFEADEDAISFWNRDRTSGRIVRTTVELFLYSFLVILNEENVKMESLFKEFKNYLKDKSPEERLEFAKELAEYGKLYATIPDGENLEDICFSEHEKRFFHVIRELDINTAMPLVLYIYKKVHNIEERIEILRVLESYLVRRNICRLTTKNYNNFFISLLKELKKQDLVTALLLKEKLLSYTEDTSRFPLDDELKIGFESSPLINKYSSEILYCIALYQLNTELQDYKKLSKTGLTLEHVMPKKWRNNWVLPEEIDEFVRDAKLLTLGNLTLVKGKLNSSMRDSAWDIKKEALRQHSQLRITTDYLQNEEWNENVISGRVKDLYETALNIWRR